MEKVVASLTKAIRKKRGEDSEPDIDHRKSVVLNPNTTFPEPIRTGVSAGGFMDIMDVSQERMWMKNVEKKKEKSTFMLFFFSLIVGSFGNCEAAYFD